MFLDVYFAMKSFFLFRSLDPFPDGMSSRSGVPQRNSLIPCIGDVSTTLGKSVNDLNAATRIREGPAIIWASTAAREYRLEIFTLQSQIVQIHQNKCKSTCQGQPYCTGLLQYDLDVVFGLVRW